MADRTIEADQTDRLQEIGNGLRKERVNLDVLVSVRELPWQLKMRKAILPINLTQIGIQKIRQKIHLTMTNRVTQLRKKCVTWY